MIGRHVRYTVRLLGRTPSFTIGTLATLALCLGATLTIFAVVDSVLLKPLPFPGADRLVSIYNTYPRAGVHHDGSSLTNYYERRGRIAAFAGVAAYREGTAIVGAPGATAREHVMRVSPDFLATLGRGPLLGRAFTEDETAHANSAVAILTHAYWTERLNGDAGVVGRRIRVDGADRTIVGVLPAQFGFLSSKARLFFPLASAPDERGPAQRHWGNSDMIARLGPGVSLADAQAQIDAHNHTLEAINPDAARMTEAGFRSLVVPLHADHVAPVRSVLLLLQAGVLLLLVLGGVNVANLLLIRASGRSREFAVRQAMGASRIDIVRAVALETILLAVLGGLLGLVAGAWGIGLLRTLGAEHLPLGVRLGFDARLGLAGLAGAILLGAAMAVPIAWYHLSARSPALLQHETRGGISGARVQRLRQGFVVAQIALALVLLTGAGQLALSLRHVMSLSPGFQAENVLTGQITIPAGTYPDRPALLGFAGRLLDDLSRQPDVLAAGFATNVPFSGVSNKSAATVKGYTPAAGESPTGIYSYGVGGDYFDALGYTLIDGRVLTAADSIRAERTCVVDEHFVRRYWPDGQAVGKLLFQGPREGDDAEAFRVVGVVGTVRQADMTEQADLGAVYYPFRHRGDRDVFVVARTRQAPQALTRTLRQVVHGIDPALPVSDVRSMDDRIAAGLVSRRSPAVLAAVFSCIALLLAAVGTYGVLSYAVAERRREIGLRMALGARPGQVRRQFVTTALRMLAVGLTTGGVGAWLAGRAMQALLYEVPAVHAVTFAGSALLLAAVAFAACLGPAWRASRLSPMEALAE